MLAKNGPSQGCALASPTRNDTTSYYYRSPGRKSAAPAPYKDTTCLRRLLTGFKPTSSVPSSRDILWLAVNGITAVNIYREPQFDTTLEILFAWSIPSQYIIAGDFDARHHTWQLGRSHGHGNSIASWASENDLSLLDRIHTPTIDLAFPNIALAEATADITMVHLARTKLPGKVGDRYTEVVLTCLSCLDQGNDFGEEDRFTDADEIRVGVRFIETVL
ncbi:endonuclease-reverse transcriptase domain-containing protein [Purpureocillium lilacinum]|uniref:Endonuclease-reverse transcriptase domain-containing protein n=1 Tax=Purpureocillium lilacinum TaxID=33203 RepID=A0A179G9C9_PURLI|nr:endonuclease-reverse transcriptase domain-containing protein [Purpureocillium lilacinum]